MRSRWYSEKFPEAFNRYEDDVDTSRIRSFQHLLLSFDMWGGKRFYPTEKQLKALAIEADKRGIPPVMQVEYRRKGKLYTGWRNILTGRWSTPTGLPREKRESEERRESKERVS